MKLALQCPQKLQSALKPFNDIDTYDAEEVLSDKGMEKLYSESKNLKLVRGTVNFQLDLIRELPSERALLVAPDVESFAQLRATVPPHQVMATLQATNLQDLFQLLPLFADSPVQVPYNVCTMDNARPFTLSLLRALVVCSIPPNVYVHLDEFLHLNEFYWYEGKPNVASLSTMIPVYLGLQEKTIIEPLPEVPVDMEKQSEALMKEKLPPGVLTTIYANIAILRKHIH